jgi:hypothetical protein
MGRYERTLGIAIFVGYATSYRLRCFGNDTSEMGLAQTVIEGPFLRNFLSKHNLAPPVIT